MIVSDVVQVKQVYTGCLAPEAEDAVVYVSQPFDECLQRELEQQFERSIEPQCTQAPGNVFQAKELLRKPMPDSIAQKESIKISKLPSIIQTIFRAIEGGFKSWPVEFGQYPEEFDSSRGVLIERFLKGKTPTEITSSMRTSAKRVEERIESGINILSVASGVSKDEISSALELLFNDGWLSKVSTWVTQDQKNCLPHETELIRGAQGLDRIREYLELPIPADLGRVLFKPSWDGHGYFIEVSLEGCKSSLDARRYLIATVGGNWVKHFDRDTHSPNIGKLLENCGPFDISQERQFTRTPFPAGNGTKDKDFSVKQIEIATLPTSKKIVKVTLPVYNAPEVLRLIVDLRSLSETVRRVHLFDDKKNQLLCTVYIDFTDINNPKIDEEWHIEKFHPKKLPLKDKDIKMMEGNRLKYLRKQVLGISLTKLGEHLNPVNPLSNQVICFMESGKMSISDDQWSTVRRLVELTEKNSTK